MSEKARSLGEVGASLLVDLVERATAQSARQVELQIKTEQAISRLDDGFAKRSLVAVEELKNHVTREITGATWRFSLVLLAAVVVLSFSQLFQGVGLHWLGLVH